MKTRRDLFAMKSLVILSCAMDDFDLFKTFICLAFTPLGLYNNALLHKKKKAISDNEGKSGIYR